MIESIQYYLEALRNQKPLVLCLTNQVTINFMANSLLALGASPIMSSEKDELEELIQISHAININIGTLSHKSIQGFKAAAMWAHQFKKPLVFDPVGAGASRIRTETARELILKSTIIRANASEILTLHTKNTQTGGVDAQHTVNSAKASAQALAQELNTTIAISGKEDFISDHEKTDSLHYGSPMMTCITGMGCTLTAVIAAFATVDKHYFEATRAAIAYFGLCGQLAEAKAEGPASFQSYFIDELYKANFDAMEALASAQEKQPNSPCITAC